MQLKPIDKSWVSPHQLPNVVFGIAQHSRLQHQETRFSGTQQPNPFVGLSYKSQGILVAYVTLLTHQFTLTIDTD